MVKVREGRVTLDDRHCWTDAWAFERLLGEADGRDPLAALPLLEKAVGLYQGPFLGRGMEEPWLLSAAERLRSKFLRGVEKLGSLRSQNGEWEKARECYLKGLEVDGLAEEFCRGALVCCRHLGLRAEGLSLYKRFEKRLNQELGIEPEARTRVVTGQFAGRDAMKVEERRQRTEERWKREDGRKRREKRGEQQPYTPHPTPYPLHPFFKRGDGRWKKKKEGRKD